jgi:hypothetical protein
MVCCSLPVRAPGWRARQRNPRSTLAFFLPQCDNRKKNSKEILSHHDAIRCDLSFVTGFRLNSRVYGHLTRPNCTPR